MTRHDEPLEDLIQADLDGALSAAERAELARLLLRDPEARRLHEDFRQTDQLLRDVASAEPPPGLRAAILAGPADTTRRGEPAHQRDRWPAYRAAAVILGGLLIVGLGLLARDANGPAENLQGSLVAAQDSPSQRAEGVTRTDLQRHDLGVPGREVVQVRVDFEPGAAFGKHRHPGEEIVYVIEGSLEYQVEDRPPVTLEAGEVLFIPAGARHSAKNVGDDNGAELATYVVEKGKPLVVMAE